jgi:cytochrome c-type biogenesis protein CcmH
MIWFLLTAGLLTVVALILLLAPLFYHRRAGIEEEEPVTALFRRQLAGIDEELAEGRLTPEEAEAARTEVTRRMLAAADREPATADAQRGPARDMSWRFGAVVAIAGLLPATAMAVYFAVGTPAAIAPTPAADAGSPHDAADLAAAAEQIKAHLKQAPNDLKGWTLLGRSLAALGRFPEALDAYNHALALSPGNLALHAELGEVLVLEAHGTVTSEAEAEFNKAPADPRSRYYAAEAALQRGDPKAAKAKLQAMLADAPADAPWRQAVADRLAELSQNGGSAPAGVTGPSGSAPGPTARDVAAAQSMTPEQRQAMIRAMVAGLASRLEQHPDDKAGWERLARAYDVLGEPDKAQAARARAEAAESSVPAPAVAAGTGGAASAAPSADSSSSPSDAQGWIERARQLEGEGRAADAITALKQGNAAFPGNLPLLEAYMNALAGGLKDDKPTPEFVAVATQVNALDAKQPDALWYLGFAAAQNGDHFRAASYWTKLVGELPASDPRRALVQHQLDSLR